MQIKLFTLLVVLFIVNSAHAWIFSSCGIQTDGRSNKGCTQAPCNAGGKIKWSRGFGSSCTVRLYSDRACKKQVGIASKNWDHNLSHVMFNKIISVITLTSTGTPLNTYCQCACQRLPIIHPTIMNVFCSSCILSKG
ncbi:unnamed protein product [Cunninghamella blakesleeana]